MKYFAVIVAGGTGNRMQTETPKQFLLLNQLPVLMHTIKAFASCQCQPKILLVLNPSQHNYWQKLCVAHNFNIPHHVISGGIERFHSVKQALNHIDEDGIVAIHDAVRPLVSAALIDEGFLLAEKQGNAVAAVQSSDSVRRLSDGKSMALKRNEIYLVQTPQTFKIDILKKAYQQVYTPAFTDDASVVEALGEDIYLFEGERINIKITYPIDLKWAEMLLRK